jgi:pimeloyl-ACP methyl ester carboxylesterase
MATADDTALFSDPDLALESMIDTYAARIADTPAAREALRVIFTRAIDDVAPDRLPPEVAAACTILDRESGLGSGGEAAEPDSDREAFDPDAVYAAVQDEESVSFGDSGLGGLLALPRTLSFWKMKARARSFGEGCGHDMVQALMQAAGPGVRFHLMGHSFGCIVVSSMVLGAAGRRALARPVDTLVLIQGAFSLWSYCPEIPTAPGRPGYFYPIIRDALVRGPIITTQSEHDAAVGRWYPLAAGVRRQVDYSGQLPRYGAVGTFGLCGLDKLARFESLRSASDGYDFQPGHVYNLESSAVIAADQGMFVGAHSDFIHPEVGHAVWSAVLAGARSN